MSENPSEKSDPEVALSSSIDEQENSPLEVDYRDDDEAPEELEDGEVDPLAPDYQDVEDDDDA